MGEDNLETKSESADKKSTLTCDECGKKFFKKHRLEGHLREHQGLKVRLFSRSMNPYTLPLDPFNLAVCVFNVWKSVQ